MNQGTTEDHKAAEATETLIKCTSCQRIFRDGEVLHAGNCQTEEAIAQRALEAQQPRVEMVNSAGDERVVNNVMRHEYRVLSDNEKRVMKGVKDAGVSFVNLLGEFPPSRERSLAITKVEEAVMWAVKGLTG